MKRFAPLVIIALIGVPLFLGITYGSKWTVGPKYSMPVALLADDRHFADGVPLDAVTAAIVRIGHQEEISGCVVGTFAGGIALVIHQLSKRPVSVSRRPEPSLDTELMRWNTIDVFSRRHLLNGGVIVFGRPGSGKTSGSGMALARNIVRDPLSTMLILAAKPEDKEMWQRIFAERKRELLIFEPGGALRCNMIDVDRRMGGDTREVVSFIMTSTEVLGSGGKQKGENGEFFEAEEQRYLHHAVEILTQAGVAVSAPNIQRFINTAAMSKDQLKSDTWREDFHNQCLRAASVKQKSSREKHDFELAREAWVRGWPEFASRSRSCVLAGLMNKLFFFNSGIARELISTTTNCSPFDMLQGGKSILVNCPSCDYGDTGALISSCWKYLTQKAVLGRHFEPGHFYNIVWSDECWQTVTSFDQHYAATSRSHGGAMCFLAQSRESFYSALKGDDGKHFADNLINMFHHRIFHALGSAEDAEYASSLLGRRRETSFGGSIQPAGDCFDAAFGHITGQSRTQTSFNESWQPILQPAVFMNGLRCGGRENQNLVDGIVVRSGEPFKSTNQNFILATFQQ